MVKSLVVEVSSPLATFWVVVEEKYVDTICLLVEANVTCVEAIETRDIFIHPLRYEVEKEVLEKYESI